MNHEQFISPLVFPHMFSLLGLLGKKTMHIILGNLFYLIIKRNVCETSECCKGLHSDLVVGSETTSTTQRLIHHFPSLTCRKYQQSIFPPLTCSIRLL